MKYIGNNLYTKVEDFSKKNWISNISKGFLVRKTESVTQVKESCKKIWSCNKSKGFCKEIFWGGGKFFCHDEKQRLWSTQV